MMFDLTFLNDAVRNLIRVGIVTSVDDEKCAVRVQFSDTDDLVSNWLPVLQSFAYQNKSYSLPDVGSQVLCVFLFSGLENGFVVGCFYSDADKPTVSTNDKHHITYDDGTVIEYDRAAHKLTADVKGSVDIKASGDISITGAKVSITATEINLNTPKVNASGAVQATGQMGAPIIKTDGGISLNDHTHGGVEGGNKSTGAPQ